MRIYSPQISVTSVSHVPLVLATVFFLGEVGASVIFLYDGEAKNSARQNNEQIRQEKVKLVETES